jgi:hypothetical protein
MALLVFTIPTVMNQAMLVYYLIFFDNTACLNKITHHHVVSC